jgi:hypothetical protein
MEKVINTLHVLIMKSINTPTYAKLGAFFKSMATILVDNFIYHLKLDAIGKLLSMLYTVEYWDAVQKLIVTHPVSGFYADSSALELARSPLFHPSLSPLHNIATLFLTC